MTKTEHLSEARVTVRGEYYRYGDMGGVGSVGTFVEIFTVVDSTDYVGVIKYTLLDDVLRKKHHDFAGQRYFEVLDIERISGSIPLVLEEMGRADLERYIILKDLDTKAPGIAKIDWGVYGDLASLRVAIETLEESPSIFGRLHAQELRQPRQRRLEELHVGTATNSADPTTSATPKVKR